VYEIIPFLRPAPLLRQRVERDQRIEAGTNGRCQIVA
jgi:hypothetical protein